MMRALALSTSQTVSLTAALLCAGGITMIAFAFYVVSRQQASREKLNAAIDSVTRSANTALDRRGDEAEDASQLSGAAEYVKALAELADKLSKLSQPVAALVVATIPFLLAATIVVVARLAE